MYYCEKCGFSLRGTRKKCPFCQGDLSGEADEEDIFPEIPLKEQQNDSVFRMLALGTLIVAAVCIAINYSWRSYGWWSAFVAAGLFSAWLVVGIAIRKRGNLPKAVLWQVCVNSVLALIWDFCTGFRGWSVDFVIPILYSCSYLMMAAMIGFLHLKPYDYLKYLGWMLFLGVIPFGLLLGGMLRVAWPSVLCVLTSAIGFAVLALFEGAALKAECIRIFHL